MALFAGNGKYLTKQLFWEEWSTTAVAERMPGHEPMYTLQRDRPGLINFGKVYVAHRDPSGYKVAMELLADYKQWTVLMGCRWFVAAKEMWDKEMDAMLQSEALAQIESIMKDGAPAQKLAAAKYLANKEYRKDRSASKGRPQRADIDRAARDLAASDRDLQEDLKRITNTNG